MQDDRKVRAGRGKGIGKGGAVARAMMDRYGIVMRYMRRLVQGRAVLALAVILILPAPMAEAQTRPRPRPDLGALQPPGPGVGQPPTQPPTQRPQLRPQPRPQLKPAPLAPVMGADLPAIGPVTKQPLPRFVSLKGGEGNARRGPGLTHRIDWVFTTKGTPLRVVAEYENWRKVEDYEGFGGWVHFTLLSVARTVIITTDMAQFHNVPNPVAPVEFQAERGVLARLLECQVDWCRVNANGEKGWAPKSVMWGVTPDEVYE